MLDKILGDGQPSSIDLNEAAASSPSTPVKEPRAAKTEKQVAEKIAESSPSPSVHSRQQSEEQESEQHGTESPSCASQIIRPQPTETRPEPKIVHTELEIIRTELPVVPPLPTELPQIPS